ncbi:MAG: hypothetical protein M1818_002075 [Claussenomyces sp. TS43310]|nr:MAG: hypothetical protein M1818_002075 [Claussenomyces sp. TS43310]
MEATGDMLSVVSTVATISKTCLQYYALVNSAKDAPRDIKELQLDLAVLNASLASLKFCEDSEDFQPERRNGLASILSQASELNSRLLESMQRHEPQAHWIAHYSIFRWPQTAHWKKPWSKLRSTEERKSVEDIRRQIRQLRSAIDNIFASTRKYALPLRFTIATVC